MGCARIDLGCAHKCVDVCDAAGDGAGDNAAEYQCSSKLKDGSNLQGAGQVLSGGERMARRLGGRLRWEGRASRTRTACHNFNARLPTLVPKAFATLRRRKGGLESGGDGKRGRGRNQVVGTAASKISQSRQEAEAHSLDPVAKPKAKAPMAPCRPEMCSHSATASGCDPGPGDDRPLATRRGHSDAVRAACQWIAELAG